MDDLINRIPACEEVDIAKKDENHPCHKIVAYQKEELGVDDFQLPEPWNGDIDNAEVLFISSNPSIDKDEDYPTDSRQKERIANFFTDRFKTMPKENYSNYWQNIFKWSGWLLLDKQSEEKLSDDELATVQSKIAITEIVHCKSKTDKIIPSKCCKKCIGKWFSKVLERFNGKYIIVVGSVAKNRLKNYAFGDKRVAFVPAPGARGYTDERRRNILLDQL